MPNLSSTTRPIENPQLFILSRGFGECVSGVLFEIRMWFATGYIARSCYTSIVDMKNRESDGLHCKII